MENQVSAFIYFHNRPLENYEISWEYFKNGFVKFVYDHYGNEWKHITPYWIDSGRIAYGFIRESSHLKDKCKGVLDIRDFDLQIPNNFNIICEVFFKSENIEPEYFTITKKQLLQDFIETLYRLFGNDWSCFDTFFEDSGECAYGAITNYPYRRKKPYLSFQSIKLGLWSINRALWEKEAMNTVEIFYILHFYDKPFFKVGRTFRTIERRLYNYLFPYSDREKLLFGDCNIDFNKSYFVETKIKQRDILSTPSLSLEHRMKEKFNAFRYNSEPGFQHVKELFKIECKADLMESVIDICTDEKFDFHKMRDFIGCSSGNELKEFNIEMGIIQKPNHFWSKKEEHKVHLMK